MATEIELKAWVMDPGELKNKLSKLAVFKGTFEKNDTFFRPLNPAEITGSPSYGVRIRKEAAEDPRGILRESIYVTYKSKKIQNGIEINDEREFQVSQATAFEEFLIHLGFKESIKKRKKGSSFDYNGMTVELTEVEGLGWFVELEILLPEKENKNTENEMKKLLCFLDLLEIPRGSIESRSYTAMLAERKPFVSSE